MAVYSNCGTTHLYSFTRRKAIQFALQITWHIDIRTSRNLYARCHSYALYNNNFLLWFGRSNSEMAL
jgi:hypothetical protein